MFKLRRLASHGAETPCRHPGVQAAWHLLRSGQIVAQAAALRNVVGAFDDALLWRHSLEDCRGALAHLSALVSHSHEENEEEEDLAVEKMSPLSSEAVSRWLAESQVLFELLSRYAHSADEFACRLSVVFPMGDP